MLDAVNYRLVVPVGFPTREYVICASGYFAGHATAGKYRHLEIRVNGGIQVRQSSQQDDNSEDIGLCIAMPYQLAASDYIEVWCEHNAGVNINFTNPWLSMYMIR